MRQDLLREDAGIPEQRRHHTAAPVWVVAVDERHPGAPERQVLELSSDDAALPAASAEPRPQEAEQRAVRDVDAESDERPRAAARHRGAEQTNIRVRRPEDSRQQRLYRAPERGARGTGGSSSR